MLTAAESPLLPASCGGGGVGRRRSGRGLGGAGRRYWEMLLCEGCGVLVFSGACSSSEALLRALGPGPAESRQPAQV